MASHHSLNKIQLDHLDRDAVIYVRQSSLMQVRDNTASTMRQYDLVHRAQSLGWTRERIHVIDQDQGHSGASTLGRDGFQALVAEVGLKHCGAVLSLEVSRLARSCSDWYHLLEICALTDTLVIDEEGIYDPGHYNDRLLLGFKGTMSEAELHWLRQRLLGGKLTKAEQGELRFRLPVGLVYDPTGKVVLDPDEEVQAAVRLVFALFEQYGSALAVVKHFTVHHLPFPERLWQRTHKGELIWEPLRCGRVLSVLHNPFYAGAYVYGRTKTRRHALPGEEPRIKGRTRQVKREDWPIVLQEAHPGYITWEQFRRHQQILDDNRTWRPEERRGAVFDLQRGCDGIGGESIAAKLSWPGLSAWHCAGRAEYGQGVYRHGRYARCCASRSAGRVTRPESAQRALRRVRSTLPTRTRDRWRGSAER